MVCQKEEINLYTKEDLKEMQKDNYIKRKLLVNKKDAAQHKNKRREDFEEKNSTNNDMG